MKVTGKRVALLIAAAGILGVGGLILHARSAEYRVENILQRIREPAGESEIGRVRQWMIDLHLASYPRVYSHDEAVWDLVQIGPPAVPLLMSAMEDSDINVRLVAIEALGWLRDGRAVEPLMAVLAACAPAARRHFADDLRAVLDGNYMEDSLGMYVSDDEATHILCGFAAEALGRIGDVRAVPRLASMLARPDSEPLNYEALALGEDVLVEPGTPGVSSIGGGLFGEVAFDDRETLKAAKALIRIGPPAIPHVAPLLSRGDHSVRVNAARVLVVISGPEAAETLAEHMANSLDFSDDETPRALRYIGTDAVGPLTRRLRDRTVAPAIREAMASLLGDMRDPSAVDGLMGAALGDEDPSVRAAAEAALTTMAVEGVDPLSERWLGAPDAKARQLAVRVLGESGHVDAVRPLAGLLGDSDPAVRAEAVRSLGGLPEWRDANCGVGDVQGLEDRQTAFPPVLPAVKEHLPAIRALLADEHAEVRRAAARAVRLLEDKEAVEALIGLLKDADPAVQEAAVVSLGSLKDPKAAKPLCDLLTDSSEDFKLTVISALVSIGHPSAAVPIRQSIVGGSGNFRYECVRAIRRIGGAAGVEALVSVLNDPFEWPITYAAVKGLEITGDERAIGPLEALAKREPDMRADIDAAIKAIRGRAAETRPAGESSGP